MSTGRWAASAVAALAIFGAWSATASAAQICVGGSGCYTSLAAAFAAAHDGDRITIAPGTYRGGVTLDKSVQVVGAGAGRTIIRGGGPVLTIGRAGSPDADKLTVSISGLTITGGLTTSVTDPRSGILPFVARGGGIDIPAGPAPTVGATVTIADSAIVGNRTEPSGTTESGDPCPQGDCPFALSIGAGIVDVGRLTLIRTLVADNVAAGRTMVANGGGIWTATNSGPGSLTLIDSTVRNNVARAAAPYGRFAEGAGIDVQDGEALVVRNSTISDNRAEVANTYPAHTGMFADSGGIHVGGSGSATIADSLISGNVASADNPEGTAGAADSGLAVGLSDFCACGQTLDLSNTAIRDNRVIVRARSSYDGPSDSALEIDGQATVTNVNLEHNVTVVDNRDSAWALGTFFAFDGDTGAIVIHDSSVTGNAVIAKAAYGPATVMGAGITNGGALQLHGVQVRGNRGRAAGVGGSAQGGGIWNGQPFGPDGNPTPTLALDGTQVLGNELMGGRGAAVQGGGVYTVGFPITRLMSLIFANTPDNCVGC